jgi:hypothetical protein
MMANPRVPNEAGFASTENSTGILTDVPMPRPVDTLGKLVIRRLPE